MQETGGPGSNSGPSDWEITFSPTGQMGRPDSKKPTLIKNFTGGIHPFSVPIIVLHPKVHSRSRVKKVSRLSTADIVMLDECERVDFKKKCIEIRLISLPYEYSSSRVS